MKTLSIASVLAVLCLGFNGFDEPIRSADARTQRWRTQGGGHRSGLGKAVVRFASFAATRARWLVRGLTPAKVTRFKAGDLNAKAQVRNALNLAINRQYENLSEEARAAVRQVPEHQMQQILARVDALIDSGARVTIKEKHGWLRPRVGGNDRKPERHGLSPNKRVTVEVKRPFGFSKTASATISRHENSMVVSATFENFDQLARANAGAAKGTLPGTPIWPGGLSGAGGNGSAVPAAETIRVRREGDDLTEVTHRLGNGPSGKMLVDTPTGRTKVIEPPDAPWGRPPKARIRDNLSLF